jgi:hypothetical protein
VKVEKGFSKSFIASPLTINVAFKGHYLKTSGLSLQKNSFFKAEKN